MSIGAQTTQIVADYEANSSAYTNCVIVYEAKTTVTEPTGTRFHFQSRSEYRRRGEYAQVIQAEFKGDAPLPPGPPEIEDWSRMYSLSNSVVRPDGLLVYGRYDQYTTDRAGVWEAPPWGESMRLDMPGADLVGSWLRGCLNGEPCAFSITLRNAQARTRPVDERIGGIACRVVDVATDGGTYTFWFDVSRNCNIVKAVIERGPDDIFGGKPVWMVNRERNGPSAQSVPRDAADELVRDSTVIDEVQLGRAQTAGGADVWVPVSGTLTFRQYDRKGRFREVKTTSVVKKIDLNPDFNVLPESFEVHPADGTPAYRRPDDGISYEWRGGKIVPTVDAATTRQVDEDVRRLHQSPLSEGTAGGAVSAASSSSDIVIASASVAVIVAALMIMVVRRRRRVRSTNAERGPS